MSFPSQMGPAKILTRIFLLTFSRKYFQNGIGVKVGYSANLREICVANPNALLDVFCYILAELSHPSLGDLAWLRDVA